MYAQMMLKTELERGAVGMERRNGPDMPTEYLDCRQHSYSSHSIEEV